jgi:hypothetical protein
VSDFGSVTLVVHQEELDVTFVVDEELLESRRKNVTGLLVGSVTYFVRTSSLVLSVFMSNSRMKEDFTYRSWA